jgi:5'-methylthioadenosine phosphorylase
VITGSGLLVDDITRDGDDRVEVLGRHGAEHAPAHRVDHLANLVSLRDRGCDRILAVASTGSLRADWPVGTVMAPDDFFGPWATPSCFDDARGHSVPGFDAAWRTQILDAWRDSSPTVLHDGGVYVQTVGPRFETPAEIRFLASVGDVVGMTVASECVLAKELGLAYAAVCIVDNMANGIEGVALTVDEFRAGVMSNRDELVQAIRAVATTLAEEAT